jgi:ribosomal protein L7/L12
MPASPFTITPTEPTQLKLETGAEGTYSFTVTSLAAPDRSQELVVEAMVIGPDGKGQEVDWLVVGPSRTLMLTGGATITMTITARPRTTTPHGEHKIQLAVADNERPHDVYAYSAPVLCEVAAKPVAPPPPTSRLPKWLIPVLAGGLVLVIVNIILIAKLVRDDDDEDSSGIGRACDASKPCETGLICSDIKKCLRPGGGPCDRDGVCASGECVSRLRACSHPLGAACTPGEKVPCFSQGTCDPSRQLCLGGVGARCVFESQCESNVCSNGSCATTGVGFRVVLANAGVNKINVIKVIRELTGLGLKEAKDLVDGAPQLVKTASTKTEALDMARVLKDAGATVEINGTVF